MGFWPTSPLCADTHPDHRGAMVTGSDPIGPLSRAVEQTEGIISRIRPDPASLPTRCGAWDVRVLVDHVVRDVQQFAARTSRGQGEHPQTGVGGDEWTKAFREAADLVVHGWDLAKATGQSTELDPEIGQLALDWGRENLPPELRGDVFGPEVSVPEDAPLHDRLVGFFGRDPDWTPSPAGGASDSLPAARPRARAAVRIRSGA
jgi:hypothetical protein